MICFARRNIRHARDETATGSASEGDDEATSDEPEEGAKAPQALQPKPKDGSKMPSSTSLESNDDNDGDDAQGAPTYRSKSKARGVSTKCGRVKGEAGKGLRRLPEVSGAQKVARGEADVQISMAVEPHVQMAVEPQRRAAGGRRRR